MFHSCAQGIHPARRGISQSEKKIVGYTEVGIIIVDGDSARFFVSGRSVMLLKIISQNTTAV